MVERLEGIIALIVGLALLPIVLVFVVRTVIQDKIPKPIMTEKQFALCVFIVNFIFTFGGPG